MGLEKYKETIQAMDRDSLQRELQSLNRIRWVSDDVKPKVKLILECLKK